MKTFTAFFALALALLLAGCTAPTYSITGTESPFTLATTQERTAAGQKLVIPAGEYRPAYRTKNGTVYRSTAWIQVNGKAWEDAGILVLADGGHAFQLNEVQRVIERLDRPLEVK